MSVWDRQKQVRAYRGQIVSPGRPTVAWRQDRVRFWIAIAAGKKTREAGDAGGVSEPVAHRWFRDAGGVNPQLPPTVSGRYLSPPERENIALWRAQGAGVREIAGRLGRAPSTISRELRRNASTRTYRLEYKASTAQWHAERRARRPKTAKLVTHDALRTYVQDKLSGSIFTADGTRIGPVGPAWDGKNKPHRGDREWVTAWSPRQIAKRLPIDFPGDPSMRISHEAIYQALYVEARGGLERHRSWHLRRGRTKRMPRARTRQQAWAHVTEDTVLSKRPKEATDRKTAGHWEGDLIIGLKRSAIATLVDRTTRFAMLVHLPRQAGYGIIPPRKNGPALAGYGAITTKNALTATFSTLPAALRRSLTWDRGKELSAHRLLTTEIGLPVYFADPKSPWQRGSNEHLNGLLRQYFPKGTDLSRWNAAEITAVADAINNRPREILDWRTPAEAFEELLRSTQQTIVATTG
ncbi:MULTISPECIES: IS30 family transposase [Micrococcales]|uniref:IS30-like element ISMsm8 family transposase n=1 Tax=Promicromonospora umidemergens TaxID=629679 RepID=A0ABP8YFM1_9MICO|nr:MULTISPECIES: IS30 family transposase [Micrococcales]MCI2267228.1 IS30 family transposase [Sediminivirga luteola]